MLEKVLVGGLPGGHHEGALPGRHIFHHESCEESLGKMEKGVCSGWHFLLGALLLMVCLSCQPSLVSPPPPPPPPPAAPAAPPSHPTVYVKVGRLNLRAGPGMDFPKIGVLERNEELEKIGQTEDWVQVRVKRDRSLGWVASEYLAPSPVAAPIETAAPEPPAAPAPASAPKEPSAADPKRPKPPKVDTVVPRAPKPAEAAEPPAPKARPKPAAVDEEEPAPSPEPKAAPAKPAPVKEEPAPPAAPPPDEDKPSRIRIM